jgi:succinate dehydrogenase / fumarate reductase, cytochrome b subunit
MKWFCKYASSSIGRKQIMAKTGLMLCLFLLVHLAGNMLLFVGPEAFNNYAHALTSNKAVLYLAEIALIGLFGTHIGLAVKLTKENRAARGGVRYAVNANAGEMTIFTSTMFYSGMWILIFLILHLMNFKYAHHNILENGHHDIYTVVKEHFQNFGWAIYYIISMAILAGHVFHGVQSAFQTFGLNHPRHNCMLKGISAVYALIIFVGFSSFPVYFFIKG